jgi:hypothetical protein
VKQNNNRPVQDKPSDISRYYKIKETTMKTNQTWATVCSAVTLILANSASAFASSGATNKVFISGPLILLFLGFCALVVVIQCIPACIMLYGMIKGTVSVTTGEKVEVKN